MKSIPEKGKPFYNSFLEAYRKKEIYKVTDEELKYYLEFTGDRFFFRHFEDRIPESMRVMYRQVNAKAKR